MSECFAKNATPIFLSTVVDLFKKIFFGEAEVLRDWLTATRILLYKRDIYDFNNNRTTMNNCTFVRIYSALINSRLSSSIEELDCVRDSARGRAYQECESDNVFVVRQIRNEMYLRKNQCIMLFLYFWKAFDRVDRQILFETLRRYKVPQYLVCAIFKLIL